MHSEADASAPLRQRRNSAGPTFDPTPYSLSVSYLDPRSGKPQDHFVEELSHYARYNRKFQLRREVTEVALKNLDQCESPEHVLVGTIAKCIRDAYAKHPDIVKYGVKIESALLDYPIEVPFRSRWQNSPGAILNEFTRVSQSKQSAKLYGMPIRISVTGLCPRSGGHRRKSEITHNINACRFVAFDFECTQHNRPDPDKDWFRHEVNFVCALVTCSECIAQDRWKDLSRPDCKVCGPRKQATWSVAEGQNALHEFVSWILHGFDKKLRMGGLTPEVVRNGHKLYEVRIEKRGIVVPTVFRDSYCLMSQPLSDLVDAYRLDIEEKQFFPHLFNKPANYARHLRHLPKRKYYAPETMKPEKRKAFKDWYRINRNTPFFLPDKLREYCTNDTQILLHALVAFRSEWMEVCQDDALRNCMTIASACMRAFKMHHLEEETLVRSPEGGYERHDRQSVIALKYLKWYASTNGVQVRHRDSPGGEYKLEYTDADGARRHFLLDGYVERPGQRPLALEFHGCAYHGCSTCFRDDTL
ncbi:hypothetical protein AAVH_23057 [Aphelenchoides avenae]|nr:hypothetical protein AAVH_23057 [Aphelenchus avenae]